MSSQYYVAVSGRRRLLWFLFFGYLVYRTADAHAWAAMIVFLIPAALLLRAYIRLAILELGALFWH
jgi:hypothetical protein